LTLPPNVVTALNLDPVARVPIRLGDNRQESLPSYEAYARWQNRLFSIRVLEVDGPTLIGTALLRGCRLEIEYRDGGAVHVTPLEAIPEVSDDR
jgi:predicted aspartyl protease